MATDVLQKDLSRFTAALDALPSTPTGVEPLEHVLAEAQACLPWPRLHLALLERVERLDVARDRLALVLHATDIDVAGAARGKGDLRAVFEVLVAAADDVALDHFLIRLDAVLEALPSARADLPAVPRLLEIAGQIEPEHETVSDALVALAARIEDLDEADSDAP